jgi:hypothetical protein
MPWYLADIVWNKTCQCCSDVCYFGEPIVAHLEVSRDVALAAGLSYNPNWQSCLTDWWTNECSEIPEMGSIFTCEQDCSIFYGDQPEGAACEAVGHRMSDCRQGLVCGADRVCHQPCEAPLVAYENDYCGPKRGMWFVSCDTGLACIGDGTCQPAQPTNSPCDATTACAVGNWCDEAAGICVSELPDGSSCAEHEQCISQICWEGFCFHPESAVCGRWAW